MISYQITSAVLALLLAGKIFFLVKRDILHPRYVYWWLLVASSTVLLGFFPRLSDLIAAPLGVSYPPILFVILGVGFLLVKMLTMDIEYSRQEQKIRRLVQRLALLEEELGRRGEGERLKGRGEDVAPDWSQA